VVQATLALGHVHAAAAAVHLGEADGAGGAVEDQSLVGGHPDLPVAGLLLLPLHLAAGQKRQFLLGAGDGHAAQVAQAFMQGIAVLDADRDGFGHGCPPDPLRKALKRPSCKR
jgi:hypothetical protein